MEINNTVNQNVYDGTMSSGNSLIPNLGGKREGAGRKKVLDETKSVTFECELQLLSLIDEKAKDNNVSRAEIIRSILKENLSPTT